MPAVVGAHGAARLLVHRRFGHPECVDPSAFEELGEALRGLAPTEFGEYRHRAHRYGVKVWFGPLTAPREHYEAQVLGRDADARATVLAIEVGFHSEYPKAAENDAVIAHLVANEKRWRRAIGKEAVVGPFLGNADRWRRVSETWPDPNLGDGELVVELATRLTDYITALEPVLRTRASTQRKRA
jgi:hypothetical protein